MFNILHNNNIKKDINILKEQNYILDKKNFNLEKKNINLEKKNFLLHQDNYILNKQIKHFIHQNNLLNEENLKLKNFITHNINIIDHVRAIPVIDSFDIDNNIILYIESLKSDNDYLNKQNILLKNNCNIYISN